MEASNFQRHVSLYSANKNNRVVLLGEETVDIDTSLALRRPRPTPRARRVSTTTSYGFTDMTVPPVSSSPLGDGFTYRASYRDDAPPSSMRSVWSGWIKILTAVATMFVLFVVAYVFYAYIREARNCSTVAEFRVATDKKNKDGCATKRDDAASAQISMSDGDAKRCTEIDRESVTPYSKYHEDCLNGILSGTVMWFLERFPVIGPIFDSKSDLSAKVMSAGSITFLVALYLFQWIVKMMYRDWRAQKACKHA